MWTSLLAYANPVTQQPITVQKQVNIKQFNFDGQTWILKLVVITNDAQTIVIDGKQKVRYATLLALKKVLLSDMGEEQEDKAIVIWKLRGSNYMKGQFVTSYAALTGDAFVDVATQKVYFVVGNENTFVVYIANLNDKFDLNSEKIVATLKKPAVNNDLEILEKGRKLWAEQAVGSPSEIEREDAPIDRVKINKEGDLLTITTALEGRPDQIWTVSLTNRIWKKTFDATAERLAKEKAVEVERKKNQTPDKPFVSEVLLWKETPGTKYEGAGVWVKRENVPAGKIAQSLADSSDFPDYLQKSLPKDSQLYWASDHNWHVPETPEIASLGWLSFYALWTLRAPNVNADGKETQFKVFDAMHNAEGEHGEKPGAFAIVYQRDGVLYATVTRPNPNNEKVRDEMPLQDAKLVSDLTAEQIKSATLSGSVSAATAEIDVELVDGTRKHWFLAQENERDLWVEQK